jgi:hypothetical protein
MNYYRHLVAGASIFGLLLCTTGRASAQTTTNNIDAPNNANSTANPVVDLNQQGSLVNTQVNTFPLGRSIVGNGVADCSSDGIALSAFGNGIGPFDTGSIGGSFTYTHSFGVATCQAYAKTQLARSSLETCLLLISNYSKMIKAGIQISYEDLKQLAGINCPAVTVPQPDGSPVGAAPQPAHLNARSGQPQQGVNQQQVQPVSRQLSPSQLAGNGQPAANQNFVQQQSAQPVQQQIAPQPQLAQPVQQQQRPATATSNQNSSIQALQ